MSTSVSDFGVEVVPGEHNSSFSLEGCQITAGGRKSVRVVRPLFPRYLFVRLNLAAEGWRSIRSTIGVTDIVCFGDQPAPLPSGVIEALQSQEVVGGFIQFADQNSFKPGDSVVVLKGPFARQLGRCDGASDNERVAILLDLLGRKVRVVLDVEAVEAA